MLFYNVEIYNITFSIFCVCHIFMQRTPYCGGLLFFKFFSVIFYICRWRQKGTELTPSSCCLVLHHRPVPRSCLASASLRPVGPGHGRQTGGETCKCSPCRAGLCLLLQCLAHADTGPSCKTWPLIQNGGELALGRLGRSCLWVCSVLSALVHLSHLP